MHRRSRIWLALTFAAPAWTAAAAHALVTLTVGPGGSHVTIQAAIDAAEAAGGYHEIRVARGHWTEQIHISNALGAGQIDLTGGWASDFRGHSGDESLTILEASTRAPVVRIDTDDGRVFLSGFTVTGAQFPTRDERGLLRTGAVALELRGRAFVHLDDNALFLNHLVAPEEVPAHGGGLLAALEGESELVLTGNRFENNSVTAEGEQPAVGGGAFVVAVDSSRVAVVDDDFLFNRAQSPANQATGSALAIIVEDDATAVVWEGDFLGNVASSGHGATVGALVLWAIGDGAGSAARIDARRCELRSNVGHEQVSVVAAAGATVFFADSLVAEGEESGVRGWARDGGKVAITNLTATANASVGLQASGASGADMSVSNTILFENGTDALFESVAESHNLIGEDPRFLDPETGDFRLALGSPAIDAGDNVPVGGLGPLDLDLQPRVQGLAVDVGAYEASAGSSPWDVPCRVLAGTVDAVAPVCRCLVDEPLRLNRCSLRLPDLLMIVRFPLELSPGKRFEAAWSLLPWTELVGAYVMTAEAEIGGEWVPQSWLGPTAPELKDDKLVVEPFTILPAASGRTPLRTTLEYRRPGADELSRIEVELLLPAPIATP